MYWRDKWSFPSSIEYEFKFSGKYGAKGEKRAGRKKATPEQIKKQNQKNKEKKVRRLIKANFTENDYWATLKYPEGMRKNVLGVYKDLKKCIDATRDVYKKWDEPFKWIYRIEIGELGGIHCHILFNRIPGKDCDMILRKNWKQGAVNFQMLYEAGGYKKLANYIVKQPDEEQYEQMSLFSKEEKKQLMKYSTSKNLIRPEPERKEYRRWTLKRLIEEGPKPTPGFYIDKDSIVYGINPYTGMSYYQYTECRIKKQQREGG